MTQFSRYAVYYLPPEGPLSRFGARWLGWDIERGIAVAHPADESVPDLTAAARKYGFHATLKPPFTLARGHDASDVHAAVSELAARQPPVVLDGAEVQRLGRFLAVTATGSTTQLDALAAACVRDLDHLRAPLTAQDLERRRQSGLSPQKEALLLRWGYPHVMEAFRFHMTLTGRLTPEQMSRADGLLATHLPELPKPFMIEQIALVGEGEDGMFRLIQRYPLLG